MNTMDIVHYPGIGYSMQLVCRRTLPPGRKSMEDRSRGRQWKRTCLRRGGRDEEVAQAHGAEEAVGARQRRVGMHHEWVALHEGPQVDHLLQLRGGEAADDWLLVVLRAQLQRPLLQLLQQLQPRLPHQSPMTHSGATGDSQEPMLRAR